MTRGCNDCTLAPGRPPFLTSFRWTKCAPPTAVRFDSPDDRTGRKGRAAGFTHARRLCCKRAHARCRARLTMTVLLPAVFFVIFIALVLAVFLQASRG